MSKMTVVVEVEWIEKERGWGQRPDGFSYYPSMEKAKRHIKKYWDSMPKEAPECYSSPCDPTLVEVDPTFELLVKGKGIIWSEKSCKIKK